MYLVAPLLAARRIQRHLAHRLALAQTQDARFGQQVHRRRTGQEIDVQVAGHRHLHPPQGAEHHRVHGGIGQRHQRRPGQRTAGTHQPRLKRHPRQGPVRRQAVDAQIDILGHRHTCPDQLLHLFGSQQRHSHLRLCRLYGTILAPYNARLPPALATDKTAKHAYQSVSALDPERNPVRCSGHQPPTVATRRDDSQARLRPVHLAAAGPARPAQGGSHRA
ncbi:hypothetical protein D3C77_540740 [compost metagenome]